jgi:hypothetical protein
VGPVSPTGRPLAPRTPGSVARLDGLPHGIEDDEQEPEERDRKQDHVGRVAPAERVVPRHDLRDSLSNPMVMKEDDMYAIIRRYSGDDLADVLVEREDEVRGVIASLDGFRSYYAVRTGDGTATVSVFDDQAGADASTKAAAEWIAENLPDASFGAPQVTGGEVAVSF